MSVWTSIIERITGQPHPAGATGRVNSNPDARVMLAEETENTFAIGARGWGIDQRERWDYDREELLRLALEAWRVNPLARRIVGLTTQYVVGGGLSIRADHPATHRFIADWFHH